MKLFNKLAVFALAGLAFVACKEEEWAPGEWDVTSDYKEYRFDVTSQVDEKDPVEETASYIKVLRDITVEEACTLQVVVVENPENIFTVGECIFAEGESWANIKVEYPNAEIGKTYTLKLAINDPRYTSNIYSSVNQFTLNVTRVKWNSLGMATLEENYTYRSSGVAELFQRDDKHEQFRIKKPFNKFQMQAGDGNFYDAERFNFWSPEASEYLVFRILSKGERLDESNEKTEITEDNLVYFEPCNIGYHDPNYGVDRGIYHNFDVRFEETYNFSYSKVLSYQADGKTPGQVQLAPTYYMSGVGGWPYYDTNGIFLITFPGYTPPVDANVRNAEHFEWETLFTGDFASGKLESTGTADLLRGKCVMDDTESAERFAKNYGTAYCITSPYAEGYNLYFAVNDEGKVTLPATEKKQNIGLTAMGDSIYATIYPNKSTFSEKVISLNIAFTNKDGSVEYGVTDEVLSNITYTTVGTADYTYSLLFTNQDGSPYVDAGLTLQQRDDKPNVYRIQNWGYGVDFTFTWDQETNAITVPVQETGDTYGSYGSIYVCDMPTYSTQLAQHQSSYDPDSKTATFMVCYHVSAGTMDGWYGPETAVFTLGGEATETPAAARAQSHKVIKSNFVPSRSVKGSYNPWKNAKKVDAKSMLNTAVYMAR